MVAVVLIVCAIAVPVGAQATHEHDHAAAAPAWQWTPEANVFFGFNYQHRKFTDFSAWESQNWFMLDGTREFGRGRLNLIGMASLEPFTLQALGSPRCFKPARPTTARRSSTISTHMIC